MRPTPHAPITDRRTAARRRASCALGLALTLSVTACGHEANDTRSATAGLPNVRQQLTANPWILRQRASTRIIDTVITIRFGNRGVLSGSTPCGAYRARFAVNESAIRIADISAGARPCVAAARGAERSYPAALRLMSKVAPTGPNHLRLEGTSRARLSYDRVK
jgi:heat shock protein HslJ